MALRKPLFINSAGFPEEMAAADSLELGALSMSGDIDMNSNKITELATPTAATDAANKSYVDAVASGLDWKQSVRLATAAALPAYTAAGSGVGKTLTANANGALTVDGVAVASGNRILVKDQAASHVDHGIYTVTNPGSGGAPFVLTRATDFDQNAEVTAGAAVFAEEGTTWGDVGFVLVTDDPITVDTTTLQFTPFTGSSSIIAGSGILKTGNQLDVELDTGANAQGAGNGGGSSGLEFDVAGVSGKLRAAVNATGGLERASGGLRVRIDDTPDTLDVDADGLKVVGLPSLFKINDVAVSANVTAANLGTLTAGATSDASALHNHASLAESINVNEAIAVGDPIEWSTTNDRIQKCQANTQARVDCFGVAVTAQASVGSPARIIRRGIAAGVLSGATAGDRYYVGNTGGLVQGHGSISAGNSIVFIGTARNATDLEVHPQYIGQRAA